MILLISIIALTAAAIIFSFLPAFRAGAVAAPADSVEEFQHDLAVYKDQLAELESEKKRGTISDEDAAQARAEIGRRVLQIEQKGHARAGTANVSGADKFRRFVIIATALIFVPGFSFLVYNAVGSPEVEAQPLVARLAAIQEEEQARADSDAQLWQLVQQAETHLRQNPDDGRGWDVLAPIYLRLGESSQAATAFENAIRILGETPARLSGLGEVRVVLAGGTVTSEADALFKKALGLDPIDGRSLYYSAIGEAQAGNIADAFAGLQAIALNESIDGVWRAAAANTIAQMGERRPESQPTTPDGSAPQLDSDTMEQMSQMPAADRQEMIAGMVNRLENRLANEGGTFEEWQRLIRAHFVLDQRQEALAAAKSALVAFEGDKTAQNEIRVFTQALGLVLEEATQ